MVATILTQQSRVANDTSPAPPPSHTASGGTSVYLYSLHGCEMQYCSDTVHTLVSYPTLSAGCHFIRHLPGSGKDWAQNCCTESRVDLIRQLITDSLIKNYRQVSHNASVKTHQSMQIEDRYEQFWDYPLGTSISETNRWRLALLVVLCARTLLFDCQVAVEWIPQACDHRLPPGYHRSCAG